MKSGSFWKKCFAESRPHFSKSRRERIFKWIFGYSLKMDGSVQKETQPKLFLLCTGITFKPWGICMSWQLNPDSLSLWMWIQILLAMHCWRLPTRYVNCVTYGEKKLLFSEMLVGKDNSSTVVHRWNYCTVLPDLEKAKLSSNILWKNGRDSNSQLLFWVRKSKLSQNEKGCFYK